MSERMSDIEWDGLRHRINCHSIGWRLLEMVVTELDRARASEERLQKRVAELEAREVFVMTPTTGGRREYDPLTVGELRGIVREEIRTARVDKVIEHSGDMDSVLTELPLRHAYWEEPTDG